MTFLALSTTAITWIVIGGIAGIGILWMIMSYNGLVAARVAHENAWSNVDVQLKRRYDLIPNLVETVKGYAAHESETLENVIKARQQSIDASSMSEQSAAEANLSGAVRQIFALSERYPDLKANENFISLQNELTSTEGMISGSRQQYNTMVKTYNIKRAVFPTVILASMFGFTEAEFFELEEQSQREAPSVSFS